MKKTYVCEITKEMEQELDLEQLEAASGGAIIDGMKMLIPAGVQKEVAFAEKNGGNVNYIYKAPDILITIQYAEGTQFAGLIQEEVCMVV